MAMLEHSPRFATEDAVRLASEHFQLEVEGAPLPSERDQNFRLTTPDGQRFVLKIANALEERSLLEAENAAMEHLAGTGLCPTPAKVAGAGRIVEILSVEGTRHFMRLLRYLPGVPLGRVKRHSDGLLESLGRAVGAIDHRLQSFDHEALHRDFHWDLDKAPEVIAQHRPLVTDPAMAELLDRVQERHELRTVPLLASLRRSVIHNDANDYNVLVGGGDDWYSRNQTVTGLLDFGDLVYSHTVNDLAIAIAYAVLDKTDPLAAATPIVRGYHAVMPLTGQEIAALHNLVCMRLAASMAIAAYQTTQRPQDPYLSISQQPVRNTLPRLAALPPRCAEYVFRDACGLEPAPRGASVAAWLTSQEAGFAPVVEEELLTGEVRHLDLSAASALVSSDPEKNRAGPLSERINWELRGAVGVGGYGEARTFPPGARSRKPWQEPLTLHLGTDLTVPAGTEVYAPLDGVIHSLGDSAITLRHEAEDGAEFFTLFGRLSHGSIEGLEAGGVVGRGEHIGWVGESSENGGSWPHLHFQIATDLLEEEWDVPTLATAGRRSVWMSLYPDPNLILRLAVQRPKPRLATSEILDQRRRRIGRNLSISYRNPLQIVRGWKQHLYDEGGRAYLDAYNNVAHVGHSHPRVVEAAQQQLAVLNTNTRYLQEQLIEYASHLTAHFPEPLSVCFFVNSGSEANELAIRLARTHTGQRDTIVLDAAYHGHTTTLIDLSPYKHDGPGGSGAPPWVHKVAIPDTYRGAYRRDDPKAGWKYACDVGRTIEQLREQGRGLCAYLAETCPSVAGQILLPEGYLAEVYRLVREAGGVTIADEVQTGFGRLGTHFWGYEAHAVVPDIVVLGKPIGNGYPLGAVVTTPEIAESFDNGMEFFSTFGGSTVSCAVGRAVLEVVEEERLQAHALRVGERMLEGLRGLMDRFPVVGDVRGSGLFLGAELVRNRETLEPAPEEASFVANRFRDHGILLGTDGPFHNVIKIRGPMPFSEANADELVEVLERILTEDFQP